MNKLLKKVQSKENLSRSEAFDAMLAVLEHASDDMICDFLVAMNKKDIVADELIGFVNGLKDKAVSIKPDVDILVDTCGTGGDCTGTINISTGAAIVTASAGIPVAKHGNYSVSSKSGSANLLEALGYNILMSPENCQEMIEKTCFGFLFAQTFHPAMKRVAQIRSQLGKKTIFNLLGPLANPANADVQLVGVYDERLCELFCDVLKGLGLERALVVYGSGLDEISNIGETSVYELNKDGVIESYRIKPEDFGFKRYDLEDIRGGAPEENANDLVGILNGEKGAKRDVLVLNSAGAIYLGRGADSLDDGIRKAEDLLDSGAAEEKLTEIIEYSKQ